MRGVVCRIGLITIVCLVALEVAIRVSLGVGFSELTWSYHLNAEGFRDRSFTSGPPLSGERIVMLGDSFTFGQGSRPEETLPRLTEAFARQSGLDVQIWNVSKQGWNTRAEVDAFLEFVKRYHVDAVVLVYTYNDVDIKPFNPGNPRVLWLFEKWRTAHIVFSALHGYWDPTYKTYWETSARAYRDANSPEWQQVVRSFIELRDACRATNIPLLVFYYELLVDGGDVPRWLAHDKVETLTRELGIPFASFPPLPSGTDLRAWRVHVLDPHPNGSGHRRAAESMIPALVSRLAPDEKKQ
jgi:lysophospholipase L1-like esterase